MEANYWSKAGTLNFQLSEEIVGGFDIGFEAGIPAETQDTLMRFAYWVENNYALPITLWVDFKNRHFLMAPGKGRVDYKFYWVDFANYPVFEKEADIPVIELPVKTGRHTLEEILRTFAQALTHYFAWLCNAYTEDFVPDNALAESVLQAYLFENPL
jgi:hypothetical protein